VDAIIAVGVNCTEPSALAAAVEVAARASGKPVIAYPNSGEGWDARTRTWIGPSGSGAAFDEAAVQSWLTAGARMVGGCCRVGPNEITAIARQLRIETAQERSL
jgi:homocysteine S-methyltransferase